MATGKHSARFIRLNVLHPYRSFAAVESAHIYVLLFQIVAAVVGGSEILSILLSGTA